MASGTHMWPLEPSCNFQIAETRTGLQKPALQEQMPELEYREQNQITDARIGIQMPKLE